MAVTIDVVESQDLNLTPMIDVVFNLLVFFLLSTTVLNDEREVELELPRVSSAAPLTESPRELTVSVLEDGRLQLEGASISLAELEARLAEAKDDYPDQAVAIRGDTNVDYGSVARVIAACRRAGIAYLDVLVREQ